MTPVLHPPNENLRLVASSARGDWGAAGAAAHAEALKDNDRGTVWRAQLLGQDCVLKCLCLGSPRRRLQSMLRHSPAWRQWRGARWLLAHGFSTGEPLAIVRGRRDGAPVECLILRRLPGQTALGHMAARDLPTQCVRLIALGVGRLAARLAREGRLNRDAKPSNLIVTGLHETDVHLGIIDCGDLRRCPRNHHAAVARMLAAALLEPIGCGLAPGLTLRMRSVRAAAEMLEPDSPRAVTRRLWRDIETLVEAHGDATPRDNPLAPPPHAPV